MSRHSKYVCDIIDALARQNVATSPPHLSPGGTRLPQLIQLATSTHLPKEVPATNQHLLPLGLVRGGGFKHSPVLLHGLDAMKSGQQGSGVGVEA